MPIAASGTVSFSDLRSEFVGGSAAISFSDLYRGGSNIRAKAANNNSTNLAASVPTSGTINFTNFRSQAKGFRYTFSATATDQDADTLFGDDYAVNYPKEIVINAGVTIGGVSDDALDIPAGLSGALTINNSGSIIGKGGAAGGGAGGNAISCATSGVTLNNLSGSIIAGGGGGGGAGGTGGTGGAGGNGSYTVTNGPTFSATNQSTYSLYGWNLGTGYHDIKWYGTVIYNSYGSSMLGSVSSGGYTYYPHSWQQYNGDWKWYNIARYYSVSTTGGSGGSGGSGGAGGAGQGYNQSNASGSAGSAGSSGASGGTNAGTGGQGGTGGTGGSGATYGSAGSTGATGSTGNTGANGTVSNGAAGSGGSAGSSGGAAGSAIAGTSITLNNSGSVYGATA